MALNYIGIGQGTKLPTYAPILTRRKSLTQWWIVAYSTVGGSTNLSGPGKTSMYYRSPVVVKCTDTVRVNGENYVKIPDAGYYAKLNTNNEVITPNAYSISNGVATKVSCGVVYLHYILSYKSYNMSHSGEPILKVACGGVNIYPRLFTTSATGTPLCIQPRYNLGSACFLLNNASFGSYGVKITCDFYTGKFWSGTSEQRMYIFGARAASVNKSATNIQQISVYMRRIGDIAVSVNDNVVAPSVPYRDNQYSILRVVVDAKYNSYPVASLYKCKDFKKKVFTRIFDYGNISTVKLSNSTVSMPTLALFGESIYNKDWGSWQYYSGFNANDLTGKDAPGILYLKFEKYNSAGTIGTSIEHFAAISSNDLAISRGFINPNYNSERDVECGNTLNSVMDPSSWHTGYYTINSY